MARLYWYSFILIIKLFTIFADKINCQNLAPSGSDTLGVGLITSLYKLALASFEAYSEDAFSLNHTII